MKPVIKAKFICSSTSVLQLPEHKLPEFAFVGRSNVGKSSIINMLSMNKQLAHTSSVPGKTVCINHFLVDDSWYLVDLPGYGYARLSKKQRNAIDLLIKQYVRQAPQLYLLFVLLDSRLPLQKIDLDFLTELGEKGLPFAVILTKSDKLSRTALNENVQRLQRQIAQYWEELPPFFVTSAVRGTGREEILEYIHALLK